VCPAAGFSRALAGASLPPRAYESKGEIVVLARTKWPRLHFRFRQTRNFAVSANTEVLLVPQNQHHAILFGQRIPAIGKRLPEDFLIGGKSPRKLWPETALMIVIT
jgi:hypothetical protein